MLNEKKKTDDKIKKKSYNPFTNDPDHYYVDEILPIQIKSRIPHWVPSKNADLFEVRKVLTSENEQLRNLNRSVGVYKVNNEIVISKSIIDEESKKLKKRINRDIANDLIIQEKIKNKNMRYYVSENRYNILSKLNRIRDLNNLSSQITKERNADRILTEDDVYSKKPILNNEVCYNPINTEVNNMRIDSTFLKTDRSKKYDFSSVGKEIVYIRKDITGREKNSATNLNHIREKNITIISDGKTYSSISKLEKNNEFLKKKDENNPNNDVLITSLANKTSTQVDEFFRNNLNKDYKSKFESNTLKELREEKEEIERRKKLNKSEEKDSKNILNKLAPLAQIYEPPISSSMRYSVRDYINKTREVVLLKHSIEIKKETALKIEENYKNQIESVTDSIVSLRLGKELFEEDFILKFDRYIKFLRVQREKELNELSNILEKKGQLELDIQKLENRKNKSKEFVRLYREYRDFLICVRERTTKLPNFFMENKNYNNNIPVILNLKKKKKTTNQKIVSTNSYNQTVDGELYDIDSSLDEEERNIIFLEKEKQQKARNKLLNQLQENNSNESSKTNRNVSIYGKNNKNLNHKETNTLQNNNLKNSNMSNVCINTNSSLNTYTNSPSKNYSANSNKIISRGNLKSSNLYICNVKTESNISKGKTTNPINDNSNLKNITLEYNNNNDKIDEIEPTLLEVDPILIEKFNYYVLKQIYKTPEDLNEDIKKLQLENINLLKKLTSIASKVNILRQETKKLVEENNHEISLLKIEVEQREINFIEIQEINKSLLDEKNLILGNQNGNNVNYSRNPNSVIDNENYISRKINKINNNKKSSLIKNKFNQAIIYSKVNEIFNLTLEIAINANINREINLNLSWKDTNLYTNVKLSDNISKKNFLNSLEVKNDSNYLKTFFSNKDSNLMFMLKIIEKSIDYLLAKEESYSKDAKRKLQLEKLRTDLEKERKITKAIEVRLKEEKRREVVNQAIIERNSKLIILPKRKFGEKIKPNEKN